MAISQELENVLLARMGSTTAGVEMSSLLNQVADTVGTTYYANSSVTTSGDGKTWATAFKTITEAVAAAVAGDAILIKGSFNEAVTCSVAGVRFIGIGTGAGQAIWTAPTVSGGSTACLTLAAGYCEVCNIKIQPVAYLASGAPSGIKLSGANYTRITRCRFQGKTGSYYAIYSPVCDSDNVVIEDNEFIYMNTATNGTAILGVEAGGLSYSGWVIRRNSFNSCVTCINICGRCCLIEGNTLAVGGITAAGAVNAAVMTMGIDLSGTGSGGNVVCGNNLGGAYSNSLYLKGATGDGWAGNWTLTVTATITNGAGMTLTATA